MVTRSVISGISLLFIAGATLLLLLTILGGTRYHRPLNEIYLVKADTSNIPGAPSSETAFSHFTLWNICGESSNNAHNIHCTPNKAAFPFRASNLFGARNVDSAPEWLVDHPHRYYYLSRFTFAFYIIGVSFTGFALITSLLALCSRLGAGIASFFTALGLVFDLAAAVLMTAYTVVVRNHFNNDNRASHLGVKASAFTWTSVVLMFLAMFMLGGVCCGAGTTERHTGRQWGRRRLSNGGVIV